MYIEVEIGKKDCDHAVVIKLLFEIVELLKTLLYELKLIIKVDIILGCALEELAKIVCALLIVCFFFLFSLKVSLK